MIRTLQTALCLLFLAAIFNGCESDRLDIDVSEVPVNVKVERLDSIWPQLTPVSFRKEHPRMANAYPSYYQHYIEDVLQMGSISDSGLFSMIRGFVTHPDFKAVFEQVHDVYPKTKTLESELSNAWRRYAVYFPNAKIPNHIACVGGFNNPYVMTEDEIGLCLELFLGSSCDFYEYLQWPVYQRNRMTPLHLIPWMMKGWLETEYPILKEQPSLLDEIVHQGKIYYCLDAIVPHTEDSIKIGYTAAEWKWAADHERMVWAHFVDKELLFSTDASQKGKYVNDGPFTVDLVKESPSRMGHYVGWKMVRAYMEKQDVVDLQKLLATPAEQILKESNYKP